MLLSHIMAAVLQHKEHLLHTLSKIVLGHVKITMPGVQEIPHMEQVRFLLRQEIGQLTFH